MVTDVRPLPGDTWLAMCDCGRVQMSPDRETGLAWLEDHVCLDLTAYPETVTLSL